MAALLAQESNKIVGYTSLAKGADQLFADVVLEHGGIIYAVIPFSGYERTLRGQERHHFKELLQRASKETLNVDGSDQDAYLAAGRRIVSLVDLMIAVWNGRKAKGKGGTADVVAYSRRRKVPLIHLNPTTQTVRHYT
jgi:hypothetical protein